MHSYINSNEHKIHFENAFDKLYQQRRRLFDIPEIDNLLDFSDGKNVCIVNSSENKNSFVYSFITKFCIDFCFDNNNSNNKKGNNQNNKTILIDAGSGNNLASIYLH